MNVIQLDEYRARKELSVEAACGIFIGMTCLIFAGAVWAWWGWCVS
jgi:Mg/Co/Ni transporter MgtE